MYTFRDYFFNALIFANNILIPRHKKLTSLMIYTTTRCQSKCRHCNIWNKPNNDLDLHDIVRIMSSKCISKYTTVGLEGGEFILHPQAEQILDYFHNNHPNYTLLSNGLYPKKVCELTSKYKPKRLYLSLDGGNEQSYSSVRGVNGYENVIKVIEK